MNQSSNLIGANGLNFNVGFDKQDIVYIGLAIFSAILLAGGILVILNNSLRKKI